MAVTVMKVLEATLAKAMFPDHALPPGDLEIGELL
jgi:hypothetical protein